MLTKQVPLAGALVAALLSAACTDAGTTLIVLQNQEPGDGCTVSADRGAAFIPRGHIDARAEDGYLFTPLVQNVAEATSNDSQRILFVEGADVDLSGDFTADGSLTSFSQAFSGSLLPGDLASFAFIIIPEQLVTQLGDSLAEGASVPVDAEITVFGTVDGGDVESQVFHYTVDVCDGCTTVNQGDCTALPDDFTAETGGNCQPLQDGSIDCCTSSGGDLVCPAVKEAPPV
jgi:hypothetical protein